MDHLRRKEYEQDIDLKKGVAKFAMWAVGAQIVAADVALGAYIVLSHDHISGAVIQSWMAATVVQVIGILLVISRYLFPRRKEAGPPRKDPATD